MSIHGYFFSQFPLLSPGAKKKVTEQMIAFCNNGISLSLVEVPFLPETGLRKSFFLRQVFSRLPFTAVYSSIHYKETYNNSSVIYLRFLALDLPFMLFLHKLRQGSPNAKIIMEFPDFPPNMFMKSSALRIIVYSPILLKFYVYQRFLRKYIDRIAILLPQKKVYGIPTIHFRNGRAIEMIRKRNTQDTNEVRIIAVANMSYLYAYDRMIEGIKNYYQNGGDRSIVFHLVGGADDTSSELKKYKKIVRKYDIEERVFIHGEVFGEELDRIYDTCNLSVAALGMHRNRWYQTTSLLKVSEYLAKGLPIITGCKIDVLEVGNFPYVLEVPNDDSTIDMNMVISFFDSVYSNRTHSSIAEEIRHYALCYADISVGMKPIIDYVLSDEL